ncbi:MAG: hypothetical protein BWY67_01066 [Bacteroidetes bacterium ADurb.Bin397]|nr:MAG: hypothetical protein BWY67_01066 [Bacteroidetes bacterium ADurb.Bin397]
MSCKTCVKINSIPECLEDSQELILTGISVADNDDVVYITLKDVATGRKDYLPFTEVGDTGIEIELTDFMPLMDHPYEIVLLGQSMEAIPFTLTNPDLTTEEGCCLEFGIMSGLTWGGGNLELSSTTCQV